MTQELASFVRRPIDSGVLSGLVRRTVERQRRDVQAPLRQLALEKIQAEIQAEVDTAVKFAIDAPYPAPDKVDQDVYA